MCIRDRSYSSLGTLRNREADMVRSCIYMPAEEMCIRDRYLDLSMGAAGDMLAAALFSLTDRRDHILQSINSLPLPGLEANLLQGEKMCIRDRRTLLLR